MTEQLERANSCDMDFDIVASGYWPHVSFSKCKVI